MDAWPTEALPPGTAEAFARLRQRFVEGLPHRLSQARHAADASQRADALHRLAGAAGSFGFAALGQAARLAEAAAGGDAPTSERALDAVAGLIDGLLSPPAPTTQSRDS